MQVYWTGSVPKQDDYGSPIADQFIDGRTKSGPWAIMTPANWCYHGLGPNNLGTGKGQRYTRQADGRWLKVEG